MNNLYSVLPFRGLVRAGASAQTVAAQLEASLNSGSAVSEFIALAPVSIQMQPGCIAKLFGAQSSMARYDQIVIGPSPSSSSMNKGTAGNQPVGGLEPARIASSGNQPFFEGSVNSARSPLNSILVTWAGLSMKARLGSLGIAGLVLLWWLGSSSPSSSPPPREPAQQLTHPTVPVPPRPLAQPPVQPPNEARPATTSTVASPVPRVGDRWLSEVTDHQDARLNYRSERTVVDVGNNRVLTTVRTLKNNYTRSIEYTSDWALLSSRLPNGSATVYSPALSYMQFPAEPGKSWSQRVVETSPTGSQKIHDIQARIGDWELVSVPAGTFQALRVELIDNISVDGVLASSGRDVSWFAPSVKRSVKSEETSLDAVTGERRRRTIVLLDFAVR